jgi:hypothetical protein
MSFFEAPPPPPEPEIHRQPEWSGPPENVLPSPFELEVVLARTDGLAILAHSGLSYPNGFSFRVALQRREAQEGLDGNPFHHWHRPQRGGIPEEALRLGVQFADGAKATVFDGARWFGQADGPQGPVLLQRGGGGGNKSWDFAFWVWPLPPEGPLALVCEWPSEHVELTRAEIDAAPIREAAARAETLWTDDDGPSGAGGGMVFSRQVR